MKYNLHGQLDYSSDLMSTILRNRGIKNVEQILNPTHENDTNVADLPNIIPAMQMYAKNVTKNILLLVDSDVDGNTSAAIIYKYTKFVNPLANISFYVHPNKKHGITPHFLECVRETKPDFIIVTDGGTNDLKNREFIVKDLGIDLLIIDHHPETCSYSEQSGILINNHAVHPTNNINKNLTGAGMTFLFCKALEEKYNTGRLNSLLDLALLGQIGDSSDLTDNEVRRMCFDGLNNIHSTLVNTFYENKDTTSLIFKDLSFGGIIPLINSIMRVGNVQDRKLMFKAMVDANMDYSEIVTKRKLNKETRKYELIDFEYNIYQLAIDAGLRCKSEQQKMLKPLLVNFQEQYNDKAAIQIFITSKENKSLTGLIANKLKSEWKAPTLVLWLDEENKTYHGSLRGFEDVLPSFKKWCLQTQLFDLVEGHDNAAGVSIKAIKMLDLIDATQQNVESAEIIHDIDLLYIEQANVNHIFEINNNKHLFGNGIDEPVAMVTNLKVPSSDIQFSKSTLRLKSGGVTFIKFGVNEHEYNEILEDSKNVPFINLDVVGTLTMSEYNGRRYPQMLINKYELKRNAVQSSEFVDYGIFA